MKQTYLGDSSRDNSYHSLKVTANLPLKIRTKSQQGNESSAPTHWNFQGLIFAASFRKGNILKMNEQIGMFEAKEYLFPHLPCFNLSIKIFQVGVFADFSHQPSNSPKPERSSRTRVAKTRVKWVLFWNNQMATEIPHMVRSWRKHNWYLSLAEFTRKESTHLKKELSPLFSHMFFFEGLKLEMKNHLFFFPRWLLPKKTSTYNYYDDKLISTCFKKTGKPMAFMKE